MTTTIDLTTVQQILRTHFDPGSQAVEAVGAGAWSRAYGFDCAGRRLVVRIGQYVDDFENDERAFRYAADDLPIPEVLAIGRVDEGYFAVSTRVDGVPLEQVDAAHWRATVPSLAAALEALRLADLDGQPGWGGWGGDGVAPYPSWSAFLLAVSDDTPARRTHGWRTLLAQDAEGAAAFVWGYDRLRRLVRDDVPRSLIHADLINRNVLVTNGQLTGVFDWGCATYGDHLYDLALFMFWSPWHPQLDLGLLRAELERRWKLAGYVPEHLDDRLRVCALHIGLDHLAYNAYTGDALNLAATAARMRELVQVR